MHTKILEQIGLQDFAVFQEPLQTCSPEMQEKVLQDLKEISASYLPLPSQEYAEITPLVGETPKREKAESSLLQNGQIAFVFLAGGQSTRFQSLGWKGTYPVYQGKSIIHLLLEKIRKIDTAHLFPTAFLISNETKPLLLDHLQDGSYEFILQKSWPVFTKDKKLYLNQDAPYFAPAGNGLVLHHLQEQGFIKKWKEQGVRYVAFVLIDNPLIHLGDASFWKEVEEKLPQIALKAVERKPFESMGALCKKGNVIELLEAAQFPAAKEKELQESNKHFLWGNSGFMTFSIDFILKQGEQKLPAYLIEKSDPVLGKHYRFEQLLTDYLKYSTNTLCYLVDREMEYAPLKRPQDLEIMQKKLAERFGSTGIE